MPLYDCVACGACCVNSRENDAEGFFDWVEIEPRAPLLARKDLVRKLVKDGADGKPHLKLDVDGRCIALRGGLGRRVRCDIYALRPTPCRRVQPGDRDCERARRERGIA